MFWTIINFRTSFAFFASIGNAPSTNTEGVLAGTGETRATGGTGRLSDRYAEQLKSVPQLAGIGPLFRSSEPIELSEADTEYVVTCIKHTFPEHLVLQVTLFAEQVVS